MLDLKLYDIPATVQLAVEQFAGRGITFTTVHGYASVVKAALGAGTRLSRYCLLGPGSGHAQGFIRAGL